MGADKDSLVSRLAESSGSSASPKQAEVPRANSSPEHFIEFFNVSKAFGENRVLDNVSFFVERGNTVVIMGRSGVGKSVTLKHIMGFLEPDAGRIIVAGQDITGWHEDQLVAIRRRVTMVFQSGALFDSLTVGENIAFPLEERGLTEEKVDARVRELADMLEVGADLDRVPSELSTGAKRAVAIARALAQDPEAILYDEPTTMVDPIMGGHMGDLILKLKRVVSQNFHRCDARHASRAKTRRHRRVSTRRPRNIFRPVARF